MRMPWSITLSQDALVFGGAKRVTLRTIIRFTLGLLVVCVPASCATGQAGSNDPVTQAELVATEATYLYDALRAIRGRWLQRTVDAPEMGVASRRPGPPPSPNAMQCLTMAYIGSEQARGDDLRRVLVLQVQEVRLIPARAQRPDGLRCSHDRPAIHVLLVQGA